MAPSATATSQKAQPTKAENGQALAQATRSMMSNTMQRTKINVVKVVVCVITPSRPAFKSIQLRIALRQTKQRIDKPIIARNVVVVVDFIVANGHQDNKVHG